MTAKILCISMLISAGHVVAMESTTGLTPLQTYVAANDMKDFDALLQKASADVVNARDPVAGDTALHMAVRDDNIAMVDALLSFRGIDPFIHNKLGLTPLQLACLRGQSIVVSRLLHRQPETNEQEINDHGIAGNTALHLAAGNGQVECLLELLQHPAIDVNALNGKKRTPLHLAAVNTNANLKNKTQAVGELLKRLDIQIDVLDDDGKTAAQIAAANGYAGIVQLFNAYAAQMKATTPASAAAVVKRVPIDPQTPAPMRMSELVKKVLNLELQNRKYQRTVQDQAARLQQQDDLYAKLADQVHALQSSSLANQTDHSSKLKAMSGQLGALQAGVANNSSAIAAQAQKFKSAGADLIAVLRKGTTNGSELAALAQLAQ